MAPSNSISGSEATSGHVVIDLEQLQRQSLLANELTRHSHQPAELYKSLPLPHDGLSIRVLDLHASPKSSFRSNRQALAATLRVVPLASSPQYTALSYRWGGYSSPKDTILCNGAVDLEVTINCRDALLALRERFGALTVWVDAICINQDDTEEKNNQVPLMEEIYTWSERVFVWLGPGDENSRKAMKWLRKGSSGSFVDLLMRSASDPTLMGRLSNKLVLIGSILWIAIYKYIDAVGSSEVALVAHGKDKLTKQDIEYIDSLFGRDWFERIWTFQEAMLAWNITVICGGDALSWAQLMAGLDAFYKRVSDGTANTNSARTLIETWMTIPRITHWNGEQRQRQVQGTSTAEAYQAEGLAFVTQAPVFLPLRLWHLLVDAIAGYAIGFPFALAIAAIFWAFSESDTRTVKDLLVAAGCTAVLGAIIALAASFQNQKPFYPCRLRHKFGRKEGESGLNHTTAIVQAIRERKSFDPRDHSYGTYGVLRRLGAQLSQSDYSKPVGRVYQDFLVDLLRWEPTMIRLLLDAGRNQLPDTPSWVPNWSDSSLSSIKQQDIYYTGRDSSVRPNLDFAGLRSVYPRPRIVPTNSALLALVTGNKLTAVAQWSETLDWVSGPIRSTGAEPSLVQPEHFAMVWDHILSLGQWFLYFRQLAHEELDRDSERRSDGDDETSTAFQTLTFSEALCVSEAALKTLKLPQTVWYDHRDDYERSWAQGVSDSLTAFLRMPSLEGREREDVIRDYVSRELRDFRNFRVIVEFINKYFVDEKRLFKANNGVLGWAPAGIAVGDFVTMILGVPWPMVLRKVDNSAMQDAYIVVGPAFVHDEWAHQVVETMQPKQITLV